MQAPRTTEWLPISFYILAMTIARTALADDPRLNTPQQKEAPTAFAAPPPAPVVIRRREHAALINDQVASGIAGNFLGEPLFRMASLLLESGPNGEEPGLLRKIGAAIISPSMGLNRLVYRDRFASVFRSNDPAVYTRVDLGESLSTP